MEWTVENVFKIVMVLVCLGIGASAWYICGIVDDRDAACNAACMKQPATKEGGAIVSGKYDMLRGNTGVTRCTCFPRHAKYSWYEIRVTLSDQEVSTYIEKSKEKR